MYKEYHVKDINGEVWKPVHSLNDNYAVSNYGRLKAYSKSYVDKTGRLFHRRERLLKIWKDKTGYMAFRPTVNGKLLSVKIHRIVAEAFIPNPGNLPFINHKDEDPTNNNVSNLEWCTQKYNSNYGTCQKRHSETLRAALRNEIHTICQYSMTGELLNAFKGEKEVTDAGFNYSSVSRCCRHIINSSQNFIWRYDDDEFTSRPENKVLHNNAREVLCYDKAMNFIKEYSSVTAAAKSVCGKDSSIARCCMGKRPSAYGFIWKYKTSDYSNKKKVNKYDTNMNLICTYDSIGEAARIIGGKGPVISMCCTGKSKTAYGFIWRYADGNK